jgi:hypothetical protein
LPSATRNLWLIGERLASLQLCSQQARSLAIHFRSVLISQYGSAGIRLSGVNRLGFARFELTLIGATAPSIVTDVPVD